MLARAESHFAVEQHSHLFGLFFVLYPLGHHHYPAAYVYGAEVFAPNLNPVVALHRACGYLQRAERHTAAAIFAHFVDIGAYLRHICGCILNGDERLYERFARVAGELLVHIVPIHNLVALERDYVFDVGDCHAVV